MPDLGSEPALPNIEELWLRNELAWFVLADSNGVIPWRAEIGSTSVTRTADGVAASDWVLRSIVVMYGTDEDPAWLKVGTAFSINNGQPDFTADKLSSRLALKAARPGDGEADRDREGMLDRIHRYEQALNPWRDSVLRIDGEDVPAQVNGLDDDVMVFAPVRTGVVFVHSRSWNSDISLVATQDVSAVQRHRR